jgi:hypothetical protein
MNGDLLIFAAIFIVAITGLCGGVVLFALHRVSSASSSRWRRVKAGHHPVATHRVSKTVL